MGSAELARIFKGFAVKERLFFREFWVQILTLRAAIAIEIFHVFLSLSKPVP